MSYSCSVHCEAALYNHHYQRQFHLPSTTWAPADDRNRTPFGEYDVSCCNYPKNSWFTHGGLGRDEATTQVNANATAPVVSPTGQYVQPSRFPPSGRRCRWQNCPLGSIREEAQAPCRFAFTPTQRWLSSCSDQSVGQGVATRSCTACSTSVTTTTANVVAAHRWCEELKLSQRFDCHICLKGYSRRSSLKTHIKSHSVERPHLCVQCGKRFLQAAKLRVHSRIHSGEKPYSCPLCGRSFSQTSSLMTHKRTHTGERPYHCFYCSKSFADNSTLTKHLRIHTGQKPYQCSVCSLKFSQSGNLSRHMKIHAKRIISFKK